MSASARARRWLIAAFASLLPALVLALPAAAQPIPSDSPVTCDPADPDPGTTTTCTAEGLGPDSQFTWSATFADGSSEAGDGTADAEGVGSFDVPVPAGEEAEGDYTVTVNGTDADGEPYEESHEGTVGGGGPLDGLGLPVPPEGEPTEEPSEGDGGEEAPAPGGGDEGETFGAPDAGDDGGQVDPVPDGAVAAGLGGSASDDTPVKALAVGLLVLAVAGHINVRRLLVDGTRER